jgi:hypothetical protein
MADEKKQDGDEQKAPEAPKVEVKHLKQKGTNMVYTWTPTLAARPDMVPCEAPKPGKPRAESKKVTLGLGL